GANPWRETRARDRVFVLEVRDPCLPVRRGDGGVDVVLHAGVAREPRLAVSLLLLALDARLPRVLDGEDAPRTVHCRAERRLVVQITPHDLGAAFLQGLRGLAVGLSGHCAHAVSASGDELARGG